MSELDRDEIEQAYAQIATLLDVALLTLGNLKSESIAHSVQCSSLHSDAWHHIRQARSALLNIAIAAPVAPEARARVGEMLPTMRAERDPFAGRLSEMREAFGLDDLMHPEEKAEHDDRH